MLTILYTLESAWRSHCGSKQALPCAVVECMSGQMRMKQAMK